MVEDLSVFFDLDGGAVPVIRQRPAVADLPFNGIVSVSDREEAQSHYMADQIELRFARADIDEGDTLVIDGVPYRVLRTDHENDGNEMCAYLSTIV